MKQTLWLLDVEALDENGVPVTLRWSNGEWMGSEYYEPRLKQPGLYTEGLFSGSILPSSRSSFGVIQIINSDGALNHLVDYAFDGRSATLDYFDGSSRRNSFRATVQRVQYSRNLFEIRLRSPSEPLDVRRSFTTYAGDNIPPDGLEGGEQDIKGTPKPRLYGEVKNFAPILVNEQKLIYQVSDLSDCEIQEAYDEGFALTKNMDYTSLEELQNVAPSSGEWRSYEGYIRLGSALAGQLTVDARTSNNLLGEVFEKIVNEANYILLVGREVLNQFGNARMIATGEETYLSMLDKLAESAGAYWRITPRGDVEAGLIRLAPVEIPDRVESLSLNFVEQEYRINEYPPFGRVARVAPFNIIGIQRRSAGSGTNGIPIWRVEIEADKIEEVQSSLAGGVSASRSARLAKEFRQSFAEKPHVRERHPLSEVKKIQSVLSSLDKAELVAGNILDLVSFRRDDVVAEVAITADLVDVPLLSTVNLKSERLGYENGRNMLVISKTFNPIKGVMLLNLWG